MKRVWLVERCLDGEWVLVKAFSTEEAATDYVKTTEHVSCNVYWRTAVARLDLSLIHI